MDTIRDEYLRLKNEEYLLKNKDKPISIEQDLIPVGIELNPNKRWAYIYERVSTEMQVQTGHSLDAQHATLTKYCEANNIQVVDVFRDSGISGKNIEDRPQLSRMLESLKPNHVVIATALSRLSRSTRDLLKIVDDIKKSKCELILLDVHIDTSTPSGSMFLTFLSGISQYERELTAERVSNTLCHLSEQGLLKTKPLYGWTRTKNGELKEIRVEQLVIQAIKEIVKNNPNINVHKLTKTINLKGFTNRKNKPFHYSTIESIIQNNDIPVKMNKSKVPSNVTSISNTSQPIINTQTPTYQQQIYNHSPVYNGQLNQPNEQIYNNMYQYPMYNYPPLYNLPNNLPSNQQSMPNNLPANQQTIPNNIQNSNTIPNQMHNYYNYNPYYNQYNPYVNTPSESIKDNIDVKVIT
jgi:DNA invertase Pin-like site-specific DNA recombinase